MGTDFPASLLLKLKGPLTFCSSPISWLVTTMSLSYSLWTLLAALIIPCPLLQMPQYDGLLSPHCAVLKPCLCHGAVYTPYSLLPAFYVNHFKCLWVPINIEISLLLYGIYLLAYQPTDLVSQLALYLFICNNKKHCFINNMILSQQRWTDITKKACIAL